MNTNQHYVSQALLRRFTTKERLQRYSIKYGKWDTSAPRSVFSGRGHNQLLAFGTYDDRLDEKLKEYEDRLPTTLSALDDAAIKRTAQFDVEVYENLCWYCAYLWNMSPFGKVKAAVDFVVKLDMDLKRGNVE